MTSYDRHASHNSPYRTGQHMPLNQSRHAPLTSVATSAMDSRPDLTSPDLEGSGQNGWLGLSKSVNSPQAPYSPGMRSGHASLQRNASDDSYSGFDNISPGEIQMQNFQEGLPPPPPVTHSWKRIDRWTEDNYGELFDQMSEGCTVNDLNELEHELDCSLPIEVRESLQCHDGQERGGTPTGIIFGCMLLDCEEIVQEWKNWKVVNEEYLSEPIRRSSLKGVGPSSSSSSSYQATNPLWRQELLDKQDSQPHRAVQKAYAHPGWIPLARDWGGNNLAVDLAPGPVGKWGQIIIFGRDYDCKYVVARSWSAFLAVVADDIESEKVFVDDPTQELKLRELKTPSVGPAYLDILRWRMDQKYGRKIQKRKAPIGSGVRPGNHSNSTGSPYHSPTEDRGRSPHRHATNGLRDPRNGNAMGRPSPLSQVSGEIAQPIPVKTRDFATERLVSPPALKLSEKVDKLVEVPTPTIDTENKMEKALAAATSAVNTNPPTEPTLPPADADTVYGSHTGENDDSKTTKPLLNGLGVEGLDEMKTVAI